MSENVRATIAINLHILDNEAAPISASTKESLGIVEENKSAITTMRIGPCPAGATLAEVKLTGPELFDMKTAERVFSQDFVRDTEDGLRRCGMIDATHIVIAPTWPTDAGGTVKVCRKSDVIKE